MSSALGGRFFFLFCIYSLKKIIIKDYTCTILRSIEQNTIIGGQLLYNIVLASHTSTQISHTYTYVSSLLKTASHLPPHPIPLSCHGTLGWAPCFTQEILTCYLFYIQ